MEFATIEGVRLGFGYNNIVVTPDLAHLTSFPFISDSALGTSNDPMKILAAVQATIQLQDGALWLAAGMSITAFDVLKITAVALVEFSPQGCDISLFCDGMASMPPDASPSMSIVYVEVNRPIQACERSLLIRAGRDDNRVEHYTRILQVRSSSRTDIVHSRPSVQVDGGLRSLLLVLSLSVRWRFRLHDRWLPPVLLTSRSLPCP